LTDSTLNSDRYPRARLLLAALSAILLAIAAGPLAAPARGDGDPASDVLAIEPLFLPQDAHVTPQQQAQLAALLAGVQRSGYQLRVAIVASPADLGSVTALWQQPQNYAQFLGQELSLLYHGTLVVVMPNGYGQYSSASRAAAARTALNGVTTPGTQLGTATLTAIQRIADTSGHTLVLPNATAPSSAVSKGPIPWIVFAIGTALIVLSWTASLRARPPQLRWVPGDGRRGLRRQ